MLLDLARVIALFIENSYNRAAERRGKTKEIYVDLRRINRAELGTRLELWS